MSCVSSTSPLGPDTSADSGDAAAMSVTLAWEEALEFCRWTDMVTDSISHLTCASQCFLHRAACELALPFLQLIFGTQESIFCPVHGVKVQGFFYHKLVPKLLLGTQDNQTPPNKPQSPTWNAACRNKLYVLPAMAPKIGPGTTRLMELPKLLESKVLDDPG
jgi:hypothetical protein